MFNLIGKRAEEFRGLYENHRLHVSAENLYFQNMRLLNTYKPSLLGRDDYKEYYEGILNDIELESSPIDVIIPNEVPLPEDEEGNIEVPDDYPLFITNQLVPEFQKIQKRVTLEDVMNTFPQTHTIRVALLENSSKLNNLLDDVFIQFLIFKYLKYIELLHLEALSNYTPIIEYMVENHDIKSYKNYLTSKKINEEKCAERFHDFIFKPELSRIHKFYSDEHEGSGIDTFDVIDLIKRLTSNVVVKSDIYIVTGVYFILSFAMSDIYNNKIEESPCAKYVRDVLSKI